MARNLWPAQRPICTSRQPGRAQTGDAGRVWRRSLGDLEPPHVPEWTDAAAAQKTTDEDANRGGETMELDAVAAGPKRFYEPAIRRPRPARARGDEPPPRSYRGTAHAGTRCASSANSRTRSRFWRALARFRRASVMPGAASALTRFRQGRLTAAWKAFDVRFKFPNTAQDTGATV